MLPAATPLRQTAAEAKSRYVFLHVPHGAILSDWTPPTEGTDSHQQEDPEKMTRYARLNAYHVSVVAYLLDKLRPTPDGDGSLLDHSLVLYGSPMSNSNEHNHGPLPVILAGGAAGRYSWNKHIRNPEHTPMNNIFLTMAHRERLDMDAFGDSTGAMDL